MSFLGRLTAEHKESHGTKLTGRELQNYRQNLTTAQNLYEIVAKHPTNMDVNTIGQCISIMDSMGHEGVAKNIAVELAWMYTQNLFPARTKPMYDVHISYGAKSCEICSEQIENAKRSEEENKEAVEQSDSGSMGLGEVANRLSNWAARLGSRHQRHAYSTYMMLESQDILDEGDVKLAFGLVEKTKHKKYGDWLLTRVASYYAKDKVTPGAIEYIEDHYFNCTKCFEAIKEHTDLLDPAVLSGLQK